MPREEKAPPGVVVWFQESGWMNANLMKCYVDYLNHMRRSYNQYRFLAIMVYDSFRGHLEESVQEKFNESNIDLAVIPGGLTSICQPLDVAINKLFKNNLCREWHVWMTNSGAEYTKAGNLWRAKINEVYGWVKCSWEGISNEIIFESFKTCEISTHLDSDLEITDKKDDVSDKDINSDDN